MVGGLETHIGEVGPRLAADGFDVTLLTTDPTGDLPATEQRDGVEIIRVRSWLADEGIYAAPGLYEAVVNDDWDLVHVQGYHTLAPPLAMLAAARSGLPFVVTFHSGGYDLPAGEQIRWAQHLVLRPLLLKARKLIAVSDWERREISRTLRLRNSRFVTIPNGAAIAAPTADVAEDPCLIVSVGRLHRYKGHQYAIAAMPYLLEAMPGIRLRVVGSGPYEPELRRQAADLGVDHSVDIGGVVGDRAAMATVLKQAALVVLLSEYESQGIAAMEALSLQRRLLVANTTALGDLAAKGWAGGISPHASPDKIAAAMLQQLTADLPPALDLPTWDDCAGTLGRLYRSVLAAA